MLKNIILLFLFLMLSSVMTADNPRKFTLGREAIVSTYKFENKKYLVLEFTEKQNSVLPDIVIFKIKFSDDTVLRLEGKKEGAAFIVGELRDYLKVTGGKSYFFQDRYVMFLVNDQQVDMLKKRIKAVAINTIPDTYTLRLKEDAPEGVFYKGFINTKDEFEE